MAETSIDRIRQTVEGLDADAYQKLMADLPPGRYQKVVDGERRPTNLDCCLIAEAGGVHVDWLVLGNTEARAQHLNEIIADLTADRDYWRNRARAAEQRADRP